MIIDEISTVGGNATGGNQIAQFQPYIDAHPNWTFVERVVAATTVYDVYRCGDLNICGIPFYVIIRANSTSTPSSAFAIAETWNESNKTLGRFAPASTTRPSFSNHDYTIGPDTAPLTDTDIFWQAIGPSNYTGNQAWVIGVNENGLYIACNAGGSYTGAWAAVPETFFPGQQAVDPLPLNTGPFSNTMWSHNNSGWAGGRCTREPLYSGPHAFSTYPSCWLNQMIGRDALRNRYEMSPIVIRSRGVGGSGVPTGSPGWAFRGIMTEDMLFTVAGSAGWGDRMIVDGDSYVSAALGFWLKED